MTAPTQPATRGAGIAGTYLAQAEGQSYQLVLNPDGSGTLNGEPGTWQQQGNQIYLSDGQQTVAVTLSGANLILATEQGSLVFVKQSIPAGAETAIGAGPGSHGTGAPAGGFGSESSAPARPFRPSNTLSGDHVTPPGTGAEFTVPDGWSHGSRREADGSEVYALTPKRGTGSIAISRRPLSAGDRQQRPSMLLQRALHSLLQGHPVTAVVPAEDIDVAGQPSARTIVRGQMNGQTMELYAAGVVAHGYGFLIVGLYPASSNGTMRPAFDTVLTTFRGSVPEENAQLRAQLIGCWTQWQGSSDRSGSTRASQTVRLNPDGTYSYRSRINVNAEGAGSMSSGSDERGRFRVEGNTVQTVSESGETGSYNVRFEGGRLIIGNDRYIPCG